MLNEYLVIFASHIDNVDKKEIALETLKSLKEESIDVCISTHCKEYISELSSYAKYLYYDDDNTFVEINDYYENIDCLNKKNCTIGSNTFWLAYSDMGYTEIYTNPKYSKPALSILRNGVHLAYSNGYKWTIYIEWDIPTPIAGYKKLIEDKIKLLEYNNKFCFLYNGDSYNAPLIWPAFVIFDTQKLYNSEPMLESKWYVSKREWIKYWGNSGFEYCLEYCIKLAYGLDILIENIKDTAYEVWGTHQYDSLSRSYITHSKKVNINVHLYPYKESEKKYIPYLAIFNGGDANKIFDVNIYCDNTNIFYVEEYKLNTNQWWAIPITILDNTNFVKFNYSIIESDVEKVITERFNVKDLAKIHDYIMNFNFFKK